MFTQNLPVYRHSKWTDFKLNSMKMYNRSSSENNVISVKKSGSLRRTNKTRTADTTDGTGGMWSDIGSVFHRGARSLRMPGKRKGMVHKDTSQWDSASSVSSFSENSEGQTASSEDRELEQNISPTAREPAVFTVGSVETSIYNRLANGSVLTGSSPASLTAADGTPPAADGTPPSSLTTDDSDPLSGSWTVMPASFGEKNTQC